MTELADAAKIERNAQAEGVVFPPDSPSPSAPACTDSGPAAGVAESGTAPRHRTHRTRRVGRLLARTLRTRLTGWLLVITVVAFWQLYSSYVRVNPTLSAPNLIARTWWREATDGSLLDQLGSTMRTMALGFALAVPLGVGIGFLMGRSRIVWGLLEPSVEILRLTPISAILPIFVLFLGIGQSMKISVFLAAGLFPLIINSYAGARSVSKVLAQTAQTYRLSWLQTQREIALPAATPYILVGMRQSLGISLVLAVFVGMLVGSDGIGYYILQAQQQFNINRLMASVFTVAAVGYLLNAIFLILERRISRWRRASMAD
jgi:ABC-type nitrate/sulfonate/bicarbonate transport system permease component